MVVQLHAAAHDTPGVVPPALRVYCADGLASLLAVLRKLRADRRAGTHAVRGAGEADGVRKVSGSVCY